MVTPWGETQGRTTGRDGIRWCSTAGHGGFKVEPEKLAAMPEPFRSAKTFAGPGWYEEDCDWCLVVLAFPADFADPKRWGFGGTAAELQASAEKTLREWRPEVWEAWRGRALVPGESHTKDRRAFAAETAGSWVVVSASGPCSHNDCPEGYVIATARVGGWEGDGPEVRVLIPDSDYHDSLKASPFGVVIEPGAYCAYVGR